MIMRSALLLLLVVGGSAASAAERPGPEPRIRISLNNGWRFKRQVSPGASIEEQFRDAEQPGYDDSSWVPVFLPHTWDATQENAFPPPDHFRGLGWYRRVLTLRPEWRGRQVSIEFKAVCQVADVWLNGRHLGRHVGGFTGFQFDITSYLSWNATNVVAVLANDVMDPLIAPANETNVPEYGGIYRSVSLLVTDPVHVSPNGVWVTTEQNGNGAILHAHTRFMNSSRAETTVRLECLVRDGDRDVASQSSNFKLDAAGDGQIEQTFQLTDPILWSPDAPHLYDLVSTVSTGTRVVDRVTNHFGVRFMGYDPAHGFTINGKFINLHGVDRRQDYGFIGDAVPEVMGVRDIQIIKEMGANFIRTAHYPQDPAVLDACDRLGILVWEEVPNIKIHLYRASVETREPVYTQRFPRPFVANLKEQMREMVERDRNHPSIIMWGLGDDLSLYHYPEDFAELSNASHELDPTRWTAARSPHVTDVLDATSEPGLLKEHERHPERKYLWNEWGSFASERMHEGAPYYLRLPADPGSEVSVADSDAAVLMEGFWMQYAAMPWLATAKWAMFDTGEPNSTHTMSVFTRKWEGRVNFRWPFNDYNGVSDMWRLPKEGYFFLQSQWTEKPMVHIVGQWVAEAGKDRRTVRVYSNAETVELTVNGRSLGAHAAANAERVWKDFKSLFDPFGVQDEFSKTLLEGAKLQHSPFIWDDVPFEPGTLIAMARAGSTTIRDEQHTPKAPTHILLKSEKPTLNAHGEDVSFIEADVVDESGTIVRNVAPWVHFEVTGPGRFLGEMVDIDAISGVAAINLQTNGTKGEITVTASSPGFKTGVVKIVGQ
jgi:beta-galactosidase